VVWICFQNLWSTPQHWFREWKLGKKKTDIRSPQRWHRNSGIPSFIHCFRELGTLGHTLVAT
jgi:hypothetical protein